MAKRKRPNLEKVEWRMRKFESNLELENGSQLRISLRLGEFSRPKCPTKVLPRTLLPPSARNPDSLVCEATRCRERAESLEHRTPLPSAIPQKGEPQIFRPSLR